MILLYMCVWREWGEGGGGGGGGGGGFNRQCVKKDGRTDLLPFSYTYPY